ncbi:MAG: mRNA-binding ribosome synthesis protein nop7 [Alectoria sarmentosa]|nr:MAG: mRNA-binding ribosome synthesis protein nop7 [Alectoria sarmentosa]
MGRIKKKGTAGQAKNFITRTQAVRKLQVSLPDFRRLCIYKGIYPREPRSKKKASKSSTPSTTFYYSRDINYLLHEPLLAKFRDHKALGKKISRHLGRGEVGDAARLERRGATKLSLDHIIKERYPTFVDALRDLDDALSLLFLFANLPSTSTVPPKTMALCQRLCLEFEHYLITTNSLRKSFLSIKGIYYQATIQGQDILWLVPYRFVQRVTGDVDFRIMGTFVEFYTTLLGFVNFRLYTSIGLIYPPRFNAKSDEQAGELGAFTLEGRGIEEPKQIESVNGHANGEDNGAMEPKQPTEEMQKQIAAIEEGPNAEQDISQGQDQHQAPDQEVIDAIDTFEPTGDDADVLPQPQAGGNEAQSLFAQFTFFLSRETPRQPLEFILRAFGCKRIGFDAILGDGAFTNNEADPTITHQIVDRPPMASLLEERQVSENPSDPSSTTVVKPGHRVPGRTYIQPQWVWDCINEVKLLRPDLYGPGATLPPHLSPWVKPTKGAYNPSAPLAEQEREGEAEEAEGLSDDEEDEEVLEIEEKSDDAAEDGITIPPSASTPAITNLREDHGMTIAGSESGSEPASEADSFAGFDSAPESDAEPALTQHQRELEAEAAGLTFSETLTKANGQPVKGILKTSKGDEARKRAAKKRREEEEELERRKMMMGRKKRKMLDKMLHSNKQKEEEAGALRAKRRKIEARKA